MTDVYFGVRSCSYQRRPESEDDKFEVGLLIVSVTWYSPAADPAEDSLSSNVLTHVNTWTGLKFWYSIHSLIRRSNIQDVQ